MRKGDRHWGVVVAGGVELAPGMLLGGGTVYVNADAVAVVDGSLVFTNTDRINGQERVVQAMAPGRWKEVFVASADGRNLEREG